MIALSFPRSDTGLLQWSQNFRDLITASPTSYGLVAADATAYGTVHTAYATALAACDPAVRNKPAVVTKNQARTNLKNEAILLANKVYSTSTVTNAQKVELGIPPRQTPAPIPAPSSKPAIEILSTSGRTVTIRLRDTSSTARRGKPAGVSGASVFSYVGSAAPADISQWKFEGNTGRTKFDVSFPPTVAAGATVFFTAFWFSGRKQSGPACDPVPASLPGGSVSLAA